MTLNEYIKMSYERPNRKVLEGLGASEGLIEYLMETPGNTNWNVVDSIEEVSKTITLTYELNWNPYDLEQSATYIKTINYGEVAPIPAGLMYCLWNENKTFFIENGTRSDLPNIEGEWWCITLNANGTYSDFDYNISKVESVSCPNDGEEFQLYIIDYDEEMNDYYTSDYENEPVYTNLTLGLGFTVQFEIRP